MVETLRVDWIQIKLVVSLSLQPALQISWLYSSSTASRSWRRPSITKHSLLWSLSIFDYKLVHLKLLTLCLAIDLFDRFLDYTHQVLQAEAEGGQALQSTAQLCLEWGNRQSNHGSHIVQIKRRTEEGFGRGMFSHANRNKWKKSHFRNSIKPKYIDWRFVMHTTFIWIWIPHLLYYWWILLTASNCQMSWLWWSDL